METILQATFYTLVLAATYLPMAVGLNLIFGVMHILNFAHGELYMLGGLFTWWAMTILGIGFFPALLLSIIVVSVLGILIERFFLRPMGEDVLRSLIVALALSMALQTSTLLIAGGDIKNYKSPFQGMVSLGSMNFSMDKLTVTVLGFAGVAIFYIILQRTKMGRGIRALAQDKQGAVLQGVNPGVMTATVMALGTALAAMAGGLAGSMYGVEPFLGADMIMFPFIIITLGGLGSMEGTLVAALFLAAVQSFITIYVGATEAAMAGFVVLYLTLLLRPWGLFGRARAGML